MNLRWHTARLRLREPLRIARGTMAHREAVQVAVAHGGHTGYGEVVASAYLQLDHARIVADLGRLRPAVARARAPEELRADLPTLAARHGVAPAVRAAVDAAVHDLVGRCRGVPVHRLWGEAAWTPVATCRTIGLGTPADAAAAAGALTRRGFTLLKVKLGTGDAEADRARVAAVRRAAPQARLLLDPNAAWSPETAVRLLARLAPYTPEAVEQPVPPGDPTTLAWMQDRCPVPVVADEDARCEADVARLAGAVAAVNIKLPECGGLTAAQAMITAARCRGLAVMLGCQVASSLGIAPTVHLTGAARWVDLDGHLLLAADPWTGIGGDDGTLRLSRRPGLGVRPVAGVR